jgi:hypothetical protein
MFQLENAFAGASDSLLVFLNQTPMCKLTKNKLISQREIGHRFI